jgi:hypothetical protein
LFVYLFVYLLIYLFIRQIELSIVYKIMSYILPLHPVREDYKSLRYTITKKKIIPLDTIPPYVSVSNLSSSGENHKRIFKNSLHISQKKSAYLLKGTGS